VSDRTAKGTASAGVTPLVEGLFAMSVEAGPLLDTIPLPLAVISPERKVLFINEAAQVLTGFSLEEARGLHCMYVMRSSLCPDKCPLAKVEDTGAAVCVDANIVSKERRKIPVRATFAPVLAPDGSIAGYVEALEDIRILQELEIKQGWSYGFGDMIGHSHEMERIFQMVPGIAQTDSSVLVTGETGTGKDLLAEAIHNASARAKGPFVKVNCGALPETLLESELFGHSKGAFTGATESKPGRFRMAHNGTLFLTEIGDLPLSLQVKLLTFLDDKVIHPLGSTKGVNVDVRIVAATHRDLRQMVREGKFREDLLYRLNVVRFHMPPLRERGEDINLFLNHFVHVFSEEFGKKVTGFSQDALYFLENYAFPGNVRELRNVVEYCVNVCGQETIEVEHLPRYLMEQPAGVPAGTGYGVQPAPEAPPAGMMPPPGMPAPVSSAASGAVNWADMERKMILDALLQAKGRKNRAAEILGWARSTLWRKMKHYEIESS
jgi:transcriptional regulator with PAS, ATPase and Fis domain